MVYPIPSWHRKSLALLNLHSEKTCRNLPPRRYRLFDSLADLNEPLQQDLCPGHASGPSAHVHSGKAPPAAKACLREQFRVQGLQFRA